jgi:hypothetical protein
MDMYSLSEQTINSTTVPLLLQVKAISNPVRFQKRRNTVRYSDIFCNRINLKNQRTLMLIVSTMSLL